MTYRIGAAPWTRAVWVSWAAECSGGCWTVLAQEPRPAGAREIVRDRGEWSVRANDYCIVYEIDDRVLFILAVGHRHDIYRRK